MLGIPMNFTFRSSANIAPSFHAGPRMFHAAGMVLHPLQLTGHVGMPGTPGSTSPSAGANFTASQIAAMLVSSPHLYTINGREPG